MYMYHSNMVLALLVGSTCTEQNFHHRYGLTFLEGVIKYRKNSIFPNSHKLNSSFLISVMEGPDPNS